MTLRIRLANTLTTTLTIALVFICATASAGEPDGPLSLSIAPSLQNYSPAEPALAPAVLPEASPAIVIEAPPQAAPKIIPESPALPPLSTDGETLTVVELTATPQTAETIDLIAEPEDLIERLRNGFSMPNISSNLVLHHQQWYTNRPDYLRRMVERSRRYLHYIIAELNKRNMPTELALLPMVESAYNPMAYSRARASGLWQFIPSTGKQYKLEQNWWIDERRDIVASTSAALDYLQYIYEMHGDWHLALASYNWGEGAVGKAIAKNKAKGLPTDYLNLTMPGETKNYVPKLQALKNIFNSPALLAEIGLDSVPNRAYFSTVTKSTNIDVKVAAKLAEMPVADFVALNPAHNRPVIKSDAPLVIPADKVDTFMSNLETHQNSDKPLSSWQSYTLRPGEKLEKVAPRFGMTVANLMAVNGIKGRIKVTPGMTLLVAGVDGGDSANIADMAALPEQPRLPVADPAPAATGRTHLVRKGETLARIAKQYGVPVAELKRINRLSSDRVAPGTRLALSTPNKTTLAKTETKTGKVNTPPIKQASKAKKPPKLTRYTIRRGDTLASIAKQFKVDKDDLLRWNRVSPTGLQPGKTLTIQLAQND
jgi:membrane-bound lytic murein transglycosylase D